MKYFILFFFILSLHLNVLATDLPPFARGGRGGCFSTLRTSAFPTLMSTGTIDSTERINLPSTSLHHIENSEFYIVVGSLFATSFFFDQSIRNFTQNEIYGGDNFVSKFLHGVGDREYVFYGALAIHSLDNLLQNSYLHETLIYSLQSLLVAEGITETFKKTFKRARPRQSPDDPFDFWHKGESFFSGHSSGAWSYLTVIATRYPSTAWLAYGLAGSVSLSRVYEDAHWTSDVLLGALVGFGVGKLTVKMNLKYTDRINILPYIDECGGRFVLVQWRL